MGDSRTEFELKRRIEKLHPTVGILDSIITLVSFAMCEFLRGLFGSTVSSEIICFGGSSVSFQLIFQPELLFICSVHLVVKVIRLRSLHRTSNKMAPPKANGFWSKGGRSNETQEEYAVCLKSDRLSRIRKMMYSKNVYRSAFKQTVCTCVLGCIDKSFVIGKQT